MKTKVVFLIFFLRFVFCCNAQEKYQDVIDNAWLKVNKNLETPTEEYLNASISKQKSMQYSNYAGILLDKLNNLNGKDKIKLLIEAEKSLITSLKYDSTDIVTLLLMGNLKYKLYDSIELAKFYYEKCLTINPLYHEANYNMGCILIAKDFVKESIPYFRRALIEGEEKYEAWFNTGDAYFSIGNADSAIYFYENSLKVFPDNAQAYYKMGLSYAKLKNDFTNGFIYLNKAIDLDPENNIYYEDLGVAYGMSGDYYKAAQIFETGLSVNPDYLPFYENLGITYGRIGNKAKSKAYYNKAKQISKSKKR